MPTNGNLAISGPMPSDRNGVQAAFSERRFHDPIADGPPSGGATVGALCRPAVLTFHVSQLLATTLRRPHTHPPVAAVATPLTWCARPSRDGGGWCLGARIRRSS